MHTSSRRRICYECRKVIRSGDPVTWSRKHRGRVRHAPQCPDRVPATVKESLVLESFLGGTISRLVEREVKRELARRENNILREIAAAPKEGG